MASTKLVSRLSSRLRPVACKVNKASLSPELSALQSGSLSQISASSRRFSLLSRLPVELSSARSMLPLHSAIASARLISSLSNVSGSWALVPQGVSMPL